MFIKTLKLQACRKYRIYHSNGTYTKAVYSVQIRSDVGRCTRIHAFSARMQFVNIVNVSDQ